MIDPQWPFRGRKEEIAELNRILDAGSFKAVRVSGRRRVGKSTFIDEVFALRKTGPKPVIMEMPDPAAGTVGDAFRRLARASEAAGFPLEDDPYDGLSTDVMRFETLLISLIDRCAAVVLDEFHHARKLGLVNAVKPAIDHYKTNLRDTEPRGKLIVTGSHQQQMIEMLKDTQPLFGRFSQTIEVPQWRLKTVLGMAADQGFLRYPGRFLSAHTALGGMPGPWRDFALEDPAGRNIGSWVGDGEWRSDFIAGQERALERQPADRWNNAAFTELSADNLAVFAFIAGRKGGFTAAEIVGELKLSAEEVRKSLETLGLYLRLVDKLEPFTGGVPRWRLCDNPSLFQMRVLGQGSSRKDAGAARAGRLADLEGHALERMTAAWLEETEGVKWSESAAWMPGMADIDAAAEREFSGARALILVGCKRSPDRHDPARLRRQFDEFMAGIGDNDVAERLRVLPRRLLLISPRFTPEARARFAGSGFECVDIRDMARSFGIDPGPEPGGPAAEAPAGPPDREILRARREIGRARKEAAKHVEQRARLEEAETRSLAEKAQAEAALAEVGWLRFRRRSGIRERIEKAAAAAGDARRQLAGLKPPEQPGEAAAELAEKMTEAERRRSEAEEEVRAMREAGTFLPRQRDPARAEPGDHAPERSLTFVVARAEHCPPPDTPVRRWHSFAVWPPGPDVSPLLALRDAFPECDLTPAAEAAALWPVAPEVDFARAEHDCRCWSVTDHIDRVEGRAAAAEPEAAAPRRRPENEGPDPGI